MNMKKFTDKFTEQEKAEFYKGILAFMKDDKIAAVEGINRVANEYGDVRYGMGLSDGYAKREKEEQRQKKQKPARPKRKK